MSDVTRYPEPRPPVTDKAGDSGPFCPARRDGFGCTRPQGHQGRHEAGGLSGRMYASWPQADGGDLS
jgi:hypothetical protein